MKRKFSFKLTCVLCTVILFMTNICVTAFAGYDYATVEVEGEQFVLGGGQGVTSDMVQNYFTDATEDESSTEVVYSSYSILSEREKEYYDRIVSTPIGETEFTIEYSPYLTKEEFALIDFRAIMYAVSFDHPEIFWYHGYSYRYKYKKSTNEVMSVIYTLKPPYVGDTEEPVYAVEDYERLNTEMWDEFHRVAEELNLANRTRYSFVKTVHDYLCTSADYVANEESCFDPYGTLVEKETVCQGYSETFKMFCDYYGVPAVCITGDTGGPHMWNAVLMEDGLWYVLDITWDDGGDELSEVYRNYFLISIYTTPFGSTRFDKSHIADVPSYKPELNYATKAYVLVNDEKFNATYNSCVYDEEQYLVLSQFTAPDHEICYNGVLVKDVLFKTGEQFTTYDDKTWTVIIAGDIDSDGMVTVLDQELATAKAISDNTTVETLQDYANDVNGDGVIDVMDIMVIQLMHTGNANDFDL